MKKIFIVSAAVLLSLTLFTGCAFIGSMKPAGGTQEPVQAVSTPPNIPNTDAASAEPSETIRDEAEPIIGVVPVETEHYEYKSDYIDVTIDVPRLDSLDDYAIQDRINAIFSDISTTAQQDIKSAEEESKKIAEERGEPIPYMLHVSYSVPYNYDGILSILFSDYRYVGGAHGGDFRTAYTFDLTAGKELTLPDLMNEGSGYRAFINTSIKKEIVRRLEAGEVYELAEFKDIGDDPAWYLTQDAIVFYFQEYEYFPYASGIQEFPIRYTDLNGMLKKEYTALSRTPAVLDSNSDNALAVGDIGSISLTGNPTTGYSWHFKVSDGSVLELSRDYYQSDAKAGEVGAGGLYTWDFRALKAGTTAITFKYYRDWLGESDAAPEDTIEFKILVK